MPEGWQWSCLVPVAEGHSEYLDPPGVLQWPRGWLADWHQVNGRGWGTASIGE